MIVEDRVIHLSVRSEDDGIWRWKMAFDDGVALDQGIMTTRIAAQVTVQRAFERRLRRAGVPQKQFTGYRWLEEVN